MYALIIFFKFFCLQPNLARTQPTSLVRHQAPSNPHHIQVHQSGIRPWVLSLWAGTRLQNTIAATMELCPLLHHLRFLDPLQCIVLRARVCRTSRDIRCLRCTRNTLCTCPHARTTTMGSIMPMMEVKGLYFFDFSLVFVLVCHGHSFRCPLSAL